MIQNPSIFRKYSFFTVVARNAQVHLPQPQANISEPIIATLPAPYISGFLKPFPDSPAFTGWAAVFLSFTLGFAGIVFLPAEFAFFGIDFRILLRTEYHLFEAQSPLWVHQPLFSVMPKSDRFVFFFFKFIFLFKEKTFLI